MEKVDILNSEWDYLIILDACRYDYFEYMYQSFLPEGKLFKKESLGCCTVEWRDAAFKDYNDDIVYISANPNISQNMRVNKFLGSEHFNKVYDVWAEDWDPRRGTVRPEQVTRKTIEVIQKPEHSNKRFIIHYLQPHAPYLCLPANVRGFANPVKSIKEFKDGVKKDKTYKIRKKILNSILTNFNKHKFLRNNLLGDHPEWFLRQFLMLSPKTPMDDVRRKYGKKILREAYERNLEIVLSYVSLLIIHLSGKIVITSDHGEQLGENRCYTHPANSNKSVLLEVPWFEIDKTTHIAPSAIVDKNTNTESSSENEVKEKLKSLGYF